MNNINKFKMNKKKKDYQTFQRIIYNFKKFKNKKQLKNNKFQKPKLKLKKFLKFKFNFFQIKLYLLIYYYLLNLILF